MLRLSQIKFNELIGENMQNLMLQRSYLQNDKVDISDLKFLRLLGYGSIGSTYLTKHKQQDVLYALKTIPRFKIDYVNLHSALNREREILQMLNHNFIMKFVKTFKDETRVYFLNEYISDINL